MKVILSRKGFDSAYGEIPSPIIDGTMLSIPIPLEEPGIQYCDLSYHGQNLEKLITDLGYKDPKGSKQAHLDPDLRSSVLIEGSPRKEGWRPLFGQDGTAQGHLKNHDVGQGDIFLFYGWFKEAELVNGKYRYLPGSPDIHTLFGWLQIGEVIDVKKQKDRIPEWAEYHPHHPKNVIEAKVQKNTLYIASESLMLDVKETGLPGGGVFTKYNDQLCLTKTGETRETRSVWELPEWFYPFNTDNPRVPLSYHSNKDLWTKDKAGKFVHLKSTSPGQEFIFDSNDGNGYPEAVEWIHQLMKHAAT